LTLLIQTSNDQIKTYNEQFKHSSNSKSNI